jgi:cobalt-zinc-cadmium efflux system protein
MSGDHQHGDLETTPASRLWMALGLTGTFLIVEIVGGIVTGSLALISDAMHMLTDAMALAIALLAIRIGRRQADLLRTYGYARFEILAAAFNAMLLLAVAFYILYEAYKRLFETQEIASLGMLAIAVVGLLVNLTSMRLLTSHKDTYLEVWADMLGSVGVIAGAIIIWLTGWQWVDSLIAVGIGFMVFPRTWVLLKECVNILLEGVPPGMKLSEVEAAIAGTPGVASVHDLHLWAITQSKVSLTAHAVLGEGADAETVRRAAETVLREKFDLHHTTLQMERETCSPLEAIH